MERDEQAEDGVRWSLVRRARTKLRRGDYDGPEVLREALRRFLEREEGAAGDGEEETTSQG